MAFTLVQHMVDVFLRSDFFYCWIHINGEIYSQMFSIYFTEGTWGWSELIVIGIIIHESRKSSETNKKNLQYFVLGWKTFHMTLINEFREASTFSTCTFRQGWGFVGIALQAGRKLDQRIRKGCYLKPLLVSVSFFALNFISSSFGAIGY